MTAAFRLVAPSMGRSTGPRRLRLDPIAQSPERAIGTSAASMLAQRLSKAASRFAPCTTASILGAVLVVVAASAGRKGRLRGRWASGTNKPSLLRVVPELTFRTPRVISVVEQRRTTPCRTGHSQHPSHVPIVPDGASPSAIRLELTAEGSVDSRSGADSARLMMPKQTGWWPN